MPLSRRALIVRNAYDANRSRAAVSLRFGRMIRLRVSLTIERRVCGRLANLVIKGISPVITIWGRSNSVNVQKVLWCCDELVLPYERIDAGLQFGRNDTPDYLAMNPTGRIPTIVDGDYVLWESHAILRYLAMQYGESSSLYPNDPKARASIDRWLDWTLAMLVPAERPVFLAVVRTPAEQRDTAKLAADVNAVGALWKMLDAQLQKHFYIEGEKFTLADVVIGSYAKRWFGLEGVERPSLPNLERWYSRLATRSGFRKYVDFPLT
jgi:glutathione S-transferase